MATETVRTRFAPSPTGYLHIGGARTALFNYLFAKHYEGKLVLRIEDTDRERSTPEARDAILDGMKWLGLDWDEGPFFQSERNEIYQDSLQLLLDQGHAYVCECPPEMLDQKRKHALAEKRNPLYDGTCRDKNLPLQRGRVVRFKTPRPGKTVVNDLVRGEVPFDHQELDDIILCRSDGSPTYNFVVVVDDLDMKISHVIRGEDHLTNTPKQLLIYQALSALKQSAIPHFAHVPLILGPDKTRLSKRHGATSVQAYREEGYLPHAMVNFLARLGWSHGDQEIFSKEELIEKFDLDHVGKSAGTFNIEKLNWTNQHYLRHLSPETLAENIRPFLTTGGKHFEDPEWVLLAPELVERCKMLSEFPKIGDFFFQEKPNYEEKAVQKFLVPEMKEPLTMLRDELKSLAQFEEAEIEQAFKRVLEKFDLKMKALAQTVRVALVGRTASPAGIFLLIRIINKDRTEKRLHQALDMLAKNLERKQRRNP